MFLVSKPGLVLAAAKANIAAACASASARSAEEYAEWLEGIATELAEFQNTAKLPTGPCIANLNLGRAPRTRTRMLADLETCRRLRLPIIISVGGDPAEIVSEVHGWGGCLLHDVATIEHAEKAAAAGVDGLVLVCGGAGGQAGTLNPFVFTTIVRRIFDGIVVLAGGLSNGRQIRAAQALGADACYMGTRFIATVESAASQAQKQMILEARASDLIYSPAFNRGVPANFLKGAIRNLGYDPDRLPSSAAEIDPEHKPWRDFWSAGQAIGDIDDIPTVADLVSRLERDYHLA